MTLLMGKFIIELSRDSQKVLYEVIDYVHDEDNHCKFEIFREGKMVAGFEPDARGFLHICKNPGDVDETTLDVLAEKIESYNFH